MSWVDFVDLSSRSNYSPSITNLSSPSQTITMEEPSPFAKPATPKTSTRLFNKSRVAHRRDTYAFIDPSRFRGALSGSIVLIPNVARGLTRSSALAFASAGATVVMTATDGTTLQPIVAEINQLFNVGAFALSVNFADIKVVKSLVEYVETNIGPIDVLLTVCMGSGPISFLHETDFMGNWWSVMERTVAFPVALIHAVLPSMVSRGRGTVISTCTTAGVLDIPFCTAEGAARSALIRFHQGLHSEVSPKGIKSFCVNPGMIAAYVMDPNLKTPPLQSQHFRQEPRIEEELTSQMSRLTERGWASVGVATGTFVALCAERRAAVLSGLYIDAERDMEQIINEIENGNRTGRERLYTLKVDEL